MCYQPIVEPGVNKFHNLSINSNHVVGVEGLSNHVWKTTYEYKARLWSYWDNTQWTQEQLR